MKQFVLLILVGAVGAQFSFCAPADPSAWKSEGAISLNASLNARFHPVPVSAVKLTGGFWSVRSKLIVDRTLPMLRQALEERGVVENFLRVSGKKSGPRKGRQSSDADLYRWMEAAAWAIASPDTPPLTKQTLQSDMDMLIPVIADAQEADGYLDTYFTGDRARLRFTDPLHSREDYCLAHLLQAGIAYYRATGERKLLNIGLKFADDVVANFGPAGKPFIAAHPELIGAMVEVYRTVGETKYLEFARYLLSGTAREPLHLKDADIRNMFIAKPFTSRTELDGEAVNALYAASGATDYFAESGDPAYKRTIDSVWTDLTTRKMTVTGGAALRPGSDILSEPYDVPAPVSNSEAPAAISNAAWNSRLLALTGDARYGDVLERTLYNSVAAALLLNGNLNCARGAQGASTEKLRSVYFENETCPPDLPGLVESLRSYLFATSRDGLYINLYNNSELNWRLEDGTGLKVVESTDYPWSGEAKFTVYPSHPSQFTIYLRWPGWSSTADFQINGNRVTGDFKPGAYVPLTRTWQSGDTITVNFPIQTQLIRANVKAGELYGKAVVERGPIVFSLDQADQGQTPIADMFFRLGGVGTAEFHKELFGGATIVKHPGFISEKTLADQPLYEPWAQGYAPNKRPSNLTLAPYFVWSNRQPDNLIVWVPILRAAEPAGRGTAAAQADNDHHPQPQ
jgi:uncharacterized protein